MWRRWHSILGLGAFALVSVLALSGAVLAVKSAADGRVRHTGLSVADALRGIAAANAGYEGERLRVSPSGVVHLTATVSGARQEVLVDVASGALTPAQDEAGVFAVARELHRSLYLGQSGRLVAGLGAGMMTLLCVTGAMLLARRLGGIGNLFLPVAGGGAGWLHAGLGRAALVQLMIVGLSGVWMAAVTFGLAPSGAGQAAIWPESRAELDPVAPWDLPGLQAIQFASVHEVLFPLPGDWFDVWTVKTAQEHIFIDQFTGDVLSREPLPLAARVLAVIRLLHTAEGAGLWAVALMVSALCVPVFGVTGLVLWWRGRGPKVAANATVATAETVILVGSEGGATWGFARALHRAMTEAGMPVHIGAMNDLARHYPRAKTLILLAATYGDGDAPASASRFLARLDKADLRGIGHLTLAFGDTAFPRYCQFGKVVDQVMTAKLGPAISALTQIDKQSPPEFEAFCAKLAGLIGSPAQITHAAPVPKTTTLTLRHRHDYAVDPLTRTAILRFSAAHLPPHRPGDLLAIAPDGQGAARLYSLASSSRDGWAEICVRRQDGGQCSPWLCDLADGASVEASFVPNPRFRLPQRRPVIMIGAGTGIAPFVGMIRHNLRRRPMDLFWGGRHPDRDALYAGDIAEGLQSGYLHRFEAAWSRNDPPAYVQAQVRAAAPDIIARLRAGATIMVCGGPAMAAAVRHEIEIIAAGAGLTLGILKRHRRYLEDVY